MLPNWGQILDTAAGLCAVSIETRKWFTRFTNSSGVDDARTVKAAAEKLLSALRASREAIVTALQPTRGHAEAPQVLAAWEYALETMIQETSGKETCSWRVEGVEEDDEGDVGGGDITLRRV